MVPSRSRRPIDSAGPGREGSGEPPPEVFTGTLLLHAFQGFERWLFEGYRERGEEGLRPKHGAVIANIDAAGTRPSVLADRAGITRAAMGELIDELEAAGYVRRVPDPVDRRAKLIKPTAKTLARQELARQVNTEVEAAYQERLGVSRYRQLRRSLADLVALTGSGAEVAQPPATPPRGG
jgi:DNA-binding MarR family transcriptional regulator